MTHIIPHKKFNGSIVPNWLMESNIVSNNAKLVYARLCQYGGKEGEAYPRLVTLSEAVALSLSTTRRALDELKSKNLITSQRKGLGKSNHYKFLVHDLMEFKGETSKCSSMSTQNASTMSTPLLEENQYKRIKEKKEVSCDLELNDSTDFCAWFDRQFPGGWHLFKAIMNQYIKDNNVHPFTEKNDLFNQALKMMLEDGTFKDVFMKRYNKEVLFT